MADFLTHAIFAEDVLNGLVERKIKFEITKRKKLFILGSQGPDMFFYYNFWPWKNSSEIVQIASMIHNHKSGLFLSEGIQYSLNDKSENSRYDLLTYIIGFICHFHLDKNIHPYVCFCSKNTIFKRDGSCTSVTHLELESRIDIIYTREKRGEFASKINLYKLFDIIPLPAIISDFYIYVLKRLFHITTTSSHIEKCVADMKTGLRLQYDPKGIKHFLLKTLCIKPPKPLYTKTENKEIDWLNRGRKEWHHPDDLKEKYTLSVDDIYENALKDCIFTINSLFERIESQKKFDDLFPNISYLTNKPCQDSIT